MVGFDILFYWERILVIGCQYVNKQSQDFRYYWNTVFRADFFSEWSKNISKIQLCRFKKWFGPFRPFNMLTVHKCSDKGLFGHFSNSTFAVYNFWKKTTFEADLVFQSILNFVQISEMQKKIEKTFFDSEIIAFQLIALNTRFYWEAIQFIGCQYGNKMSQDFRYY